MNVGSSTRHIWLSAGLLSAAFLGMAATVWWHNVRQRSEVDAAARRELEAICDARTIQIDNWRRERVGDGRLIMALGEMREGARLVAGRGSSADRSQVLAAMRALQEAFGYADATLVNLRGNVAMRLEETRFEQAHVVQRERAELAAQAQAVKAPTLSDLKRDRSQSPILTLTIPVADAGALILEIDPTTFLFPHLTSWPSPRRTGETFLARRDGEEIVYLSPLRFLSGGGMPGRSVNGVAMPSDAELDAGVLLRGPDYRGAITMKHMRRVPGSPWFVVAKIDEAEVREPINRLAWELTAILALIAIANGTGIGLIWKSHQLRLRHESEERFRSIANETPALLWMGESAGGSVFVNTRLSSFLGVRDQTLPNWTNFVHPDDAGRVKAEAAARVAARARLTYEARVRRADGEYRWVIVEGLPRTGARGESLGYAGAMLDITERKLAEQKLRDANAVLAEGLEEKTRKEAEIRALSARLIHAQEEERRRLSRELHDDLSQQIAALSIGMGNLKRGIPAEQSESRGQSDRLQQRLVDLSEVVRRMSHELHPAILQHSGLGPALRGFCREFSAVSGVQVELRLAGELCRMPSDVALTVFRIVQEALRNTAKHAHVNAAEVELVYTGQEIRLAVADRGTGFDPTARGSGLGLVSIRERTRLVEGTVEVESAPGHGTRLTVTIPDRTADASAATTG